MQCSRFVQSVVAVAKLCQWSCRWHEEVYILYEEVYILYEEANSLYDAAGREKYTMGVVVCLCVCKSVRACACVCVFAVAA